MIEGLRRNLGNPWLWIAHGLQDIDSLILDVGQKDFLEEDRRQLFLTEWLPLNT